MKTIWKFEAYVTDDIEFHAPGAGRVAHVAVVTPRILTVWLHVDTDEPLRPVRFRVVGTGHPTPPGEHVGTAIDGPFVWHVFTDEAAT